MATDPKAVSGVWSDLAAEIWETRFEPQRGPLFAAVVRAAGIGTNTCLLDAGCGGGGVSLEAARAGARVYGCDLSPGVLATAKRKVPSGEFKVGNLASLPYEPNTFDVAIACDSLLSPSDAVAAITELSRVSKPTGNVCIVVWGPPSESDYSRVLDAMQSLLPSKPTVTPLALSWPGLLDAHIATVGLRILRDEVVRLSYRFRDFDDYWSCGRELGGIKLICHSAGEEKVREAVYQSARSSIRSNGELVMENTYRLVVTSSKPL